MRPARESEVPAFGSVWQWDAGSSSYYLALGLRPRPGGQHLMLLAVYIHAENWTAPAFDDQMTWGYVSEPGQVHVTDGWMCVAEAPHA